MQIIQYNSSNKEVQRSLTSKRKCIQINVQFITDSNNT